MHFFYNFVAFSLACTALAAPKNTFRPWKIGMGTNPARHMPVPEPANYEVIIGQIRKPKSAEDLKGNMPPPAGPEPELQKAEVKKTDGKLKKDKDLMMENKAKMLGNIRPGKYST